MDASPLSAPASPEAPSRRETSALPPIERSYLLVTFVPTYVDEDGSLWLDRLWHHDLREHLRYLRCLTLASPRRPRRDGPRDLVRVDVPEGGSLSLVELPDALTTRAALRSLPALVRTLWETIGAHDIVHSGVAGWPLPPGWVANPIAMLRRKKLLLVVESAPWRASTGRESRSTRTRGAVTETFAKYFVRHADLTIFTQPDYRRTLGGRRHDGVVAPASWIHAEDVVSEAVARARWSEHKSEPVELLFAGRLTREKGVLVLLDALARLDAEGVTARVTILGEGPERGACEVARSGLRTVQLTLHTPVDYGAPFFALLDRHQALLVPSLADEQPRIVFDAHARALPVLASDTDGLRPHVDEGRTGWRVARGDAGALARTIARAAREPEALFEMGLAARKRALTFTHRAMHEERWRVLVERFGAG